MMITSTRSVVRWSVILSLYLSVRAIVRPSFRLSVCLFDISLGLCFSCSVSLIQSGPSVCLVGPSIPSVRPTGQSVRPVGPFV